MAGKSQVLRSEIYQKLLSPSEKVNWASWAWSRYALPKTRFIVWLTLLDKLKTKDRLQELGITPNNSCPLCGTNSESSKHLFFSYRFSKNCLEAVMSWLNSNARITLLVNLATKKWRISNLKKKVFCIALNSLVYQICQTHNEAIWQAKVKSTDAIVKAIKEVVKAHSSIICIKENDKDSSWLYRTIYNV